MLAGLTVFAQRNGNYQLIITQDSSQIKTAKIDTLSAQKLRLHALDGSIYHLNKRSIRSLSIVPFKGNATYTQHHQNDRGYGMQFEGSLMPNYYPYATYSGGVSLASGYWFNNYMFTGLKASYEFYANYSQHLAPIQLRYAGDIGNIKRVVAYYYADAGFSIPVSTQNRFDNGRRLKPGSAYKLGIGLKIHGNQKSQFISSLFFNRMSYRESWSTDFGDNFTIYHMNRLGISVGWAM